MESSEVFINEEIEFSIGDEDYFWIGSYEVVTEVMRVTGTLQPMVIQP